MVTGARYRPTVMTVEIEPGIVGRAPDELRAFYIDVMGFELVDLLEFDVGTVTKLRRGAARLKIFGPADEIDPATEVAPWFRPGGWRYVALYLEGLDAVDEMVRAVQASSGRVVIEPRNHRPGARMAMITDPEGNLWEILGEE